jgi:hypothetical protein
MGCRTSYSLGLEPRAKEFVWSVVTGLKDVTLYRLATPRNPLVVFNR